MKRGFTLAEVLITVGVIGVVAALTLPALMSNTTSKRFAAHYKKSVSTLNEAVLMAEAHYNFNLSGVSATCKNGASDTMADMTICGLFNSTLAGATFIPQETIGREEKALYSRLKTVAPSSDMVGYALADGSSFYFDQHKGSCTAATPCYGFIDVNGKSLPNIEVSGTEKINGKQSEFYVPTDSQYLTDVYPIYMYGRDVLPGSLAAEVVLTDSPIISNVMIAASKDDELNEKEMEEACEDEEEDVVWEEKAAKEYASEKKEKVSEKIEKASAVSETKK